MGSQATDYLTNGDFAGQHWLKHSSNQRISTVAAFTDNLRAQYPDYAVTNVQACKTDFESFAAAGHATLEVLDDAIHLASREFIPKPTKWSTIEEKVKITTHFAKYLYTWRGQKFFIYAADVTRQGQVDQLHYFIVHKPDPGHSCNEVSGAVRALIETVSRESLALKDEILVFDQQRWSKSPELWQAVREARWEDVILDPSTKTGLIKDIDGFFNSRESYKKFGIQWKRGIILHGTPGNGKTISIKAIMNMLSQRAEAVPSLYVKSLKTNRGPQYAVDMIFRKARETAPCLLILEDIDSLISDEVRSYFLNEVDGLASNDGILIVGSTNHLDALDPAIVKRPSRFDRKYPFLPPATQERVKYAEYWCDKLTGTSEVRLDYAQCPRVAEVTEGFTFAYLKEAFMATLFEFFRASADAAEEGSEGGEASVKMDAIRENFLPTFEKQVEVLRAQMSEESTVTTETEMLKEEEKRKKAAAEDPNCEVDLITDAERPERSAAYLRVYHYLNTPGHGWASDTPQEQEEEQEDGGEEQSGETKGQREGAGKTKGVKMEGGRMVEGEVNDGADPVAGDKTETEAAAKG
ncbi:hypothetical protein MMC25_004463 [Agyrium rufum]|nr:hypothetical protein [Agyrium rufum]